MRGGGSKGLLRAALQAQLDCLWIHGGLPTHPRKIQSSHAQSGTQRITASHIGNHFVPTLQRAGTVCEAPNIPTPAKYPTLSQTPPQQCWPPQRHPPQTAPDRPPTAHAPRSAWRSGTWRLRPAAAAACGMAQTHKRWGAGWREAVAGACSRACRRPGTPQRRCKGVAVTTAHCVAQALHGNKAHEPQARPACCARALPVNTFAACHPAPALQPGQPGSNRSGRLTKDAAHDACEEVVAGAGDGQQ